MVAEVVRDERSVAVYAESADVLVGLGVPDDQGRVVPAETLRSVLDARTPQPIAALVEGPAWTLDDILGGGAHGTGLSDVGARRPAALTRRYRRVVLAVGLQDPGNVGTLIRSARAFGASGVLLASDGAAGAVDVSNPKVVRSSSGHVLRVPSLSGRVEVLLDAITARGVTLLAATGSGRSLWHTNLRRSIAVVVGSEGGGLPAAVVGRCDEQVTIPMDPAVESLNVGVAASIFLAEADRQLASSEQA